MNIIPVVDNLIIEVTRRCNMKCTHCLRGGIQKLDIDLRHIDTVLKQVSEIRSLVFTGGEPSLNVHAIRYTLDKMKEEQVALGSFFIATNGKDISEEFVLTCLMLYAYSDEKDMCGVAFSNDQYHDKVKESELVQGLSFYSKRYSDGRNNYLIKQGRAKNNYDGRKNIIGKVESRDDFNETSLYLNCLGQIVNGCDWSYVNQKHYVLCFVEEFAEYYESLKID